MDAIDMQCCGVKEINGISRVGNYETRFIQLCNEMNFNPHDSDDNGFCRFFVFTQATRGVGGPRGYGETFKKWILTNKMGKVNSIGGDVKNPNSGKYLKVFIWTADWEAIRIWAKADANRLGEFNGYYNDEDEDQNWFD